MPIGEKRRSERAAERQKKIGEKFYWLTIHSEGELVENNCCTFNCICDCGNMVKNVLYKDVRRGWPRSCGCKHRGIVNNQIENLKNKLLKNIKISESGCWEWQKCTSYGYGRINIKGKLEIAHRISYQLFKGNFDNGLFVCHSCDNRCCINPDHLFLGTHEDNMKDMCKKDRVGRIRPRKSREEVIKLRSLYPKYTIEKIAEIYNSDQSTIGNIIRRKTYVAY